MPALPNLRFFRRMHARRTCAARLPRRGPQNSAHASAGLTLIEVMIGFVVLGTTALAALSALLFCYRLSDAHLRTVCAMQAARSIAEQIVALDITALGQAQLPVDTPSSTVGSLPVGSWSAARTDDIHDTPSNPADDLSVAFFIAIDRTAVQGVECAQIIVRYRWDDNSFGRRRTQEDSITLLKSMVKSF